jgi:hypothetical protein
MRITAATFVFATAATGALAVLGSGAGPATAAPTGGASADDAISDLQAQGYNVRIRGAASGPLSRCVIERVEGLRAQSESPGTVVVDLSCPNNFSTD